MRNSIITTVAAAALAITSNAPAQDKKDTEKAAPAEPAPATPAAPAKVEPTGDNISYALGIMIGRNLKENGLKVENVGELAKAIGEIMEGKEPRFNDQQVRTLMMAAQKAQMKEEMKKQADSMIEDQKTRVIKEKEAYDKALAAAEKDVVAARDFLAENAKRKEVKTTASGLQYEVLKPATGKKPGVKDTFVAHYKGTFMDGKEFDNSFTRDEPLTLPLLQVVPGWTEGLQLMEVGSRYKFFVPSYLGYGAAGRDGIPAHAPLIFEVELLGIE